jgi:hypothetical protein
MKDVLCMTAHSEMTMEQPSADTLKIILSGHWKLGGDLPRADKIQAAGNPKKLLAETQYPTLRLFLTRGEKS